MSLEGQVTPVASGIAGAELDRPYAGGEYAGSKTGVVAFIQGGPDEPGDLATAAGGTGAGGPARRLTTLNATLFEGKALAHVEKITVPSSVDHLPIDAWLMTPPDYEARRRYPIILEIHGGPYSAYGPEFASELQLFAAAGYVVLYANPRGSRSHGFDFADTINDNYPSHDYDDLIYQALQIRAVPTALIRVPGASHHALAERPSQQAAEAAAILAWFGKYRTAPAP